MSRNSFICILIVMFIIACYCFPPLKNSIFYCKDYISGLWHELTGYSLK